MASSSRRSVSDLLREAASRLDEMEGSSSSTQQSPNNLDSSVSRRTTSVTRPGGLTSIRHPVDAEVARLFAPGGMRNRQSRQTSSHGSTATYTHTFCCLAQKDTSVVPRRGEKESLQRAGLGEKRICFRGDFNNPGELTECLFLNFPKLRDAGGFELLRVSGNTRSRQLSVLPCPNEGYSVHYLKDPSVLINHSVIYIRPLQRTLCMNQDRNQGVSINTGPQIPCLLCGDEYPFTQMRQHNRSCTRQSQSDRERQSEADHGEADVPTTSVLIPSTSHHGLDLTEMQQTGSVQGGSCTAEIAQPVVADVSGEEDVNAWVTEPDPLKAAELYTTHLCEANKDKDTLTFTLSLRDTLEERNRKIVTFYKRPRVDWTRPLQCHLIGDVAVGEGVNRHVLSLIMSNVQHGMLLDEETEMRTLLFEGEMDHLIPSTSKLLLESDFFVVAGRIIGHSFLNGGPRLVGLSPAIMHSVFGGDPETATITEFDCVDQDVREVLDVLQGNKELSEEEKSVVRTVTLPWDLPGVTENNRLWLREKILLHAVLGRTTQQVKHIRRGLKDASVWEFFSSRPDAVKVLFPRACEAQITPQVILDNINWPRDEDVDEDIVSLSDHRRIMGYLQRFIETGTSAVLKSLLTFWTGWDVLSSNLEVEVIDCALPQSSTCFLTLKLPKNSLNYDNFCQNLMASMSSSYSGFGQI